MTRQVHAVMQDAQDSKRIGMFDAKDDEMPSLAPVSRDMERADARSEIMARPDARDCRAFKQGFERQTQCCRIVNGLLFAEMCAGPGKNRARVLLGVR